jgi:predicted phosphodiesterase
VIRTTISAKLIACEDLYESKLPDLLRKNRRKIALVHGNTVIVLDDLDALQTLMKSSLMDITPKNTLVVEIE